MGLSKEYLDFRREINKYAHQKCSHCGKPMNKCDCNKGRGLLEFAGQVPKTPNPDEIIDRDSKFYFRKRKEY